MPLTARAIGVLEELAIHTNHGGAKGLAKRLGEGRDAIQAAITDLKNEGYVETVVNRLSNGKVVKTLRLTSAGNQFLVFRSYTLLNKLNPKDNLLLDINTDLLIHKPNSNAKEKEDEMEYEDTPMYIDPEDMAEYRRRHQNRKHAEKMAFHEQRSAKRMRHRDETRPEDWTTTDSSFEFADQMNRLWHVAPWKVTQSRFRFALDNKRSEYNTDGSIEQKMMRLFFDKIKHDTKINDPEKIWRKFIVEFPSLLIQVQRESATPEQVDEELERSMKSRSKLRVQD